MNEQEIQLTLKSEYPMLVNPKVSVGISLHDQIKFNNWEDILCKRIARKLVLFRNEQCTQEPSLQTMNIICRNKAEISPPSCILAPEFISLVLHNIINILAHRKATPLNQCLHILISTCISTQSTRNFPQQS